MIIGIDASKAARKNRTGIENYVFELILNLQKIDQKNIYYLYTNKTLPSELTRQSNFVEKKISVRRLWNSFFLPIQVLIHRPDIYFQPSDSIPWSAPKKTIAVVHDLASFVFPGAYSPTAHLREAYSLKTYERRAKKIICISESTKKDYLHYFPKMKRKTTVITLGYDKERFYPEIDKKIEKDGAAPYLFYSGRIEERKNIIRLVKAFSILKKEKHIPHKLFLAGSPGYGFEGIIDFTKNNPDISGDIIMPGYIDDEELQKMVSGADVVVSPSLYEGFGLTVLEAMASGAAVVTSNISSLPEVAGEGAILCDPLDERDIADKIYALITNPKLKENLQKKAIKQAEKFSWGKTARETLNILEQL